MKHSQATATARELGIGLYQSALAASFSKRAQARSRVSPHERVNTVVIGGGQAGLAVGHYLAQRGVSFVILDAHERIGDAWRSRWDSLRLFTPARYNRLPGMRFPARGDAFITKDQM